MITGGQKEFLLGIIALCFEGIPQLLDLAMVMTHWNGEFDTTALNFYAAFVDIPLCIWYLSFYCSPVTKYVVIGKMVAVAFDNSSQRWSDFIEKYIHIEEEVEDTTEIELYENKIHNYDNSQTIA